MLGAPVVANQHIRRMRGGTQAQLMRCSDDEYYVVKFQNNPQGRRILANECLGYLLAEALHLPVAPMRLVNVSEELIRGCRDLMMELPGGRRLFQAGLCFGSRYGGCEFSRPELCSPILYDFLPDALVGNIENLSDFLGMLLFDRWTGNTDDRQIVFVRIRRESPLRALMIDQGFCFNGTRWNFPDTPKMGLYVRAQVYRFVEGIESFEPWIERLTATINRSCLREMGEQIPREWYGDDRGGLQALLDCLDRRRRKIDKLLWAAFRKFPQFFPSRTRHLRFVQRYDRQSAVA